MEQWGLAIAIYSKHKGFFKTYGCSKFLFNQLDLNPAGGNYAIAFKKIVSLITVVCQGFESPC